MPEAKATAKVLYVEPNWACSVVGENNGNTQVSLRQPALEDMCIFVNLEVEKKGRMVTAASQGTNQTFVMQWISTDGKGDRINFLSGSKIYYNTKDGKKSYVNSLTTNYTNTYLADIEEGKQTNELFGISSIDIKYDQYMVPEVHFEFVDVRGGALFALEELRHNQTVGNISGYSDKDIAGSFFSCFFTFPYPRFVLTIKGFYGQPTAYELTVTNFNAKFDSQTGNFNVSVDMKGYYFSFLNDISFNCIMSAPYADCGGKEYWESMVDDEGSDFFLEGVDGGRFPMPTIGDLLIDLVNIEEKIGALASGSSAQESSELQGQQEAADSVEGTKRAYVDAMKKDFSSQSAYGKIETIDSGRYIIFLSNNKLKKGDKVKDFKAGDFTNAKTSYEAFTKKVNESGDKQELPEFGKSVTPAIIGVYTKNNKYEYSNAVKALGDKVLMDAVNLYFTTDANKAEKDRNIDQTAYNKKDHYSYGGYIVDLKKTYGQTSNDSQKEEELAANKEAETQRQLDELGKVLGFYPTMSNIVKIIFAHMECYLKMMFDLGLSIYDDKPSRTLKNLGMGREVGSDMNQSQQNDNFVPPFPRLTKRKVVSTVIVDADDNLDGTKKSTSTAFKAQDGKTIIEEEEWCGNLSHNFQEENFIEGLLNGAKELGIKIHELQMNQASGGTSDTLAGKSGRQLSVSTPITPSDMVITENPWGSMNSKNGKQMSDADFVGKTFLRMEQVLAYAGERTTEASKLGVVDGSNFAKAFPKPTKEFATKVTGNTMTFDSYFTGILKCTQKQYQQDGSFPWSPQTGGNLALCNNSYGLNIYKKGGNTILPIQTRNFKKITSDLRLQSDGTCASFPSSWNNYLPTSDDGITDNIRPKNLLVVDLNYLDYSDYYDKVSVGGTSDKKDDDALQKEMFGSCKFKLEEYIKYYNTEKLKNLCGGYEMKDITSCVQFKVKRLPGINSKLNVSTSEKASLFGSKAFLKVSSQGDDIYVKSLVFLHALYKGFYGGDNSFNALYDKLMKNDHFVCMPQYFGLMLGGQLWANSNKDLVEKYFPKYSFKSSDMRKDMQNILIYKFKYWTNLDFKGILRTANTGLVYNEELEKMTSTISSKDIGKYGDEKVFAATFTQADLAYDSGSESFNVTFNDKANTQAIMKAIAQPAMFVRTCGNAKTGTNVNLNIGENKAKAYWDGFMKQLKTEYASVATSDSTTSEPTTTTAENSEAPEELKIALYHYCKTFFDKWISGSNIKEDFDECWTLGNFFPAEEGVKGRFHFIDSYYNDTSDKILCNPQVLVEDIMSSTAENGHTLLSVLADILGKNRYNFMCIQNFMDLSSAEKMNDMFKPVPFLEIEPVQESPDFVALYVYEPSKHLDKEDGNYPDDSFMLNGDDDTFPLAVQNKRLGVDYVIPAFGVAYGMQYQSYFKDVDVSMDKPQNTEQSLKLQFLLAGAHTETTMAKQYITWGQDLYTIYSNTSYTSTVTMMGCAWVQPLMYFCLTNVPMFKGSYLIEGVKHKITPGYMETIFSGVRMPNLPSRTAKNWIAKGYFELGKGGGAAFDETAYASIDNDCQYKVYNLFGDNIISTGGGATVSTNVNTSGGGANTGGGESINATNIWQKAVKALGCWFAANVNSYQGAPNNKSSGKHSSNRIDCPLIGKPIRDDCSGFVSACIWLMGHKDFPLSQSGDFVSNSQLESYGFQKISYSFEGRQPWDIMAKHGHVEVYAGCINGKHSSWSWGDNHHNNMPSGIDKRSYTTLYRYTGNAQGNIATGTGGGTTETFRTSVDEKDADKELSSGFTGRAKALQECLAQTVLHSTSITGTLTFGGGKTGATKDASYFTVECTDTTTLASVFDMCLNGYNSYVSELTWYSKDSVGGDIVKVGVKTTSGASTTTVYYKVGDTSPKDFDKCNQNFYKALYKKYKDISSSNLGTLQKEVPIFGSCKDANKANELLSGSGVQPCPRPQYGSGADGSGGNVPAGTVTANINAKIGNWEIGKGMAFLQQCMPTSKTDWYMGKCTEGVKIAVCIGGVLFNAHSYDESSWNKRGFKIIGSGKIGPGGAIPSDWVGKLQIGDMIMSYNGKDGCVKHLQIYDGVGTWFSDCRQSGGKDKGWCTKHRNFSAGSCAHGVGEPVKLIRAVNPVINKQAAHEHAINRYKHLCNSSYHGKGSALNSGLTVPN